MGDVRLQVGRLLEAAGLSGESWTVESIDSVGLLNAHYLVTLTSGSRFVVRRYGWPWGPTEPFDRMSKEAWLLSRLASAGVPAPQFIAADRHGNEAALLMSYVEGVPLGVIDDRTDAMWRATGSALRTVHEADIGMQDQPAGLLLDGHVDEFVGGWGQWHVRNTGEHAERLAAARPELTIDVDRCVAVVDAARPLIDARPIGLVHTDANPWNVLVRNDSNEAVWLDWEFAWIADPLYDFVRMTLARKRDLGPLPSALFEGYGGDPTADPVFDLYALGFHLWMGNEAQAPLLPLQTTYDNAEKYLRNLPWHLSRIEASMT